MNLCTILLSVLLSVSHANLSGSLFFRHLSPEDGLVHPAVISMCQDSLGKMWFGTEDGVCVYDGSRFRTILEGGSISSILCDNEGNTFFISGSDLMRYDVRKDEVMHISDSISTIALNGDKLYAVRNSSLLSYDHGRGMTMEGTLPCHGASQYLVDHSGQCWLASDMGLTRFEPGAFPEKILDDKSIFCLFESSSHDIWVGSRQQGITKICTDGSMMHFTIKNSGKNGLASDDVRQITEDKDGNIWFGTFNGLHMYDRNTGTFTVFTRTGERGGLSQSSVYPVMIDGNGTLWAGTYYGGVSYTSISGNSFRFFTESRNGGLSHPLVSSMMEDSKGNIWICTEGGGLNMLEPESGKIRQFRSSSSPFYLPSTNLKALMMDDDGQSMFVATTSSGLFSYNFEKDRFTSIVSGATSASDLDNISIMAKSHDKIFLSTRGGVYVHSIKEKTDTLIERSLDINRYPMTKAADGSVWVGSSRLLRYDPATLDIIQEVSANEEGGAFHPLAMTIMTSGDLLVSMKGRGIMRVRKGSNELEPFIMSESDFYQIVQNEDGMIAVSQKTGISVYYADGTLMKSFSIGPNLPLSSIVLDSGLLWTSTGLIYAGGTAGLICFRAEAGDNPTGLYFSGLNVDDERITPDDGSGILNESMPFIGMISVPSSVRRLEIEFALNSGVVDVNYSDFEYRMSPDEENWHVAEDSRLSFMNLSSGKHHLEVRDINNPDGTNACLDIFVQWPWFLRWWAWIMWIVTTAAVASLIYFTIRTRKKAAENALKEKLEKDRLVEINEAKLKFFTSVSHEFKTPLTLMSSQIDMVIHDFRLNPAVQSRLVNVMHQAKELSGLVSDLIEFRKIEQGRSPLNVTECSLAIIAETVFNGFCDYAKGKGLDFRIDIQEGLEPVVIDKGKISRLIQNLISNAVKYTAEGGCVTIRVYDSGQTETISVVDTGMGISDVDQKHIFDRFYRGENGDSGSIQGSGIGLALVKEIAERHHADLLLTSEEGVGSTFSLVIMKGRKHFSDDSDVLFSQELQSEELTVDKTPVYTINENASDVIDDNISGDTILIVEDNDELRSILRDIFSPVYSVLTASNGKQGLDIVRKEMPVLVISDIMMPEMDGRELLRSIKTDIGLCHIPVVLLTALDMPEQYLSGLLEGADDYISKPFNSKILMARCNNIIRSRKAILKQFKSGGSQDIINVATNKLDKEFLEKFNSIVEKQLGNFDMNNDTIAREMGMSRASFYNKFKSLTNETPSDYISNYRLNKAAALLVGDGNESIAEIADLLGFNSSSYLSKRFKEKFGLSPHQYRLKHLGKSTESNNSTEN